MNRAEKTSVCEVACPASPLGEIHIAVYDTANGIWKCYQCQIGGTGDGFAHLNSLEAERHRLAIELDIKKFELELAARGAG